MLDYTRVNFAFSGFHLLYSHVSTHLLTQIILFFSTDENYEYVQTVRSNSRHWTSPFALHKLKHHVVLFYCQWFHRDSLQTHTNAWAVPNLLINQSTVQKYQFRSTFIHIWILIMYAHRQRMCNANSCSTFTDDETVWCRLLNEFQHNDETECVLERAYQMDRKSIER